MDLNVLCLNGDGCRLTLKKSTLGREVHQMVSEQLPRKKGARLALSYLTSPLILSQTLQQQGISGESATLSCTYIPIDLVAAWRHVTDKPVGEGELALQGVTQIHGAGDGEYLYDLPQTLEKLTLGNHFVGSLERVSLPHNLRDLAFGYWFNQSLAGIILPNTLQSLKFGFCFNRSMEGVDLPDSLQSLTFGHDFNQSMNGVSLPNILQKLTFGLRFNKGMQGVSLPNTLQSLTFGDDFNKSMEGVRLPNSLQSLTLGCRYDRNLTGAVFAKHSAKLRIWRRFQSEPGRSQIATLCAKLDIRILV